jgi:hypothetical protein
MPNLTHALENASTTAVSSHPSRPADGPYGIEQVFAFLMIPIIVVGYHVAVTVLKLIGHRDR